MCGGNRMGGAMPGYIMHLAEGKIIQELLADTGILAEGATVLFEAGLLLPDTKRKKEKYTSHFWNYEDMDKLAIPPDLKLFLAKYRSRLREPLFLGYYAHLHLDRRFVEEFWPRCFQFLDGEGRERRLWDEIRQVRIRERDITVAVDEFYSDAWYYGDYSRMNGYFQEKYRLTVPETDLNALYGRGPEEVQVKDLREVFSELSLLFARKSGHKNEPLRVFSLDGLDLFLQDTAVEFAKMLALFPTVG